MSGSVKLAIYLFLTVLVLFFVVQAVKYVLGIFSFLVPIVLVVAVVAVLLTVVSRRALGGGRRRILP